MSAQNNNLQKLIDRTTIIKVTDQAYSAIHGDDTYTCRFYKRPDNNQIDLSTLDASWQRKWESFGNIWSKERQNYRNLYDTFRLFHAAFRSLVMFKTDAIHSRGSEPHLNDMCGAALWSMYHNGKKCVDLMKTLALISEGSSDYEWCGRLAETRNKLIEHNYQPRGFPFIIDPCLWGMADTSSMLEVNIHGAEEREFVAYVDYYQDYFDLEKVLVGVINGF